MFLIMDYLPCQRKIPIQKLILGIQSSLFVNQFSIYDKYCCENILPFSIIDKQMQKTYTQYHL